MSDTEETQRHLFKFVRESAVDVRQLLSHSDILYLLCCYCACFSSGTTLSAGTWLAFDVFQLDNSGEDRGGIKQVTQEDKL